MLQVLTIAAGIVTIVCFIIRKVDARASEQAAMNAWLSDRLLVYPPQPLSPQLAGLVQSLMEDDCDLWWHLGYSPNDEDAKKNAKDGGKKPYELRYDEVIKYGRYLFVLGPDFKPALCYGVFEDNDQTVFRVWIEFGDRNKDKKVWVLSGDEDHLRITRFSDFRVYHPGLIHRRLITFE